MIRNLALTMTGLLLLAPAATNAAVINPADINGLSTFTTADSLATISTDNGVFAANVPANTFFGITAPSGDPNAASINVGEDFTLAFDARVGLSAIWIVWTDAPVSISGFVDDPGLASADGLIQDVVYDNGVLSFDIPWGNDLAWNATPKALQFTSIAASAGQTLTVSILGGQVTPNQVVYDVVPEPASMALLAMSGGVLLLRRGGLTHG